MKYFVMRIEDLGTGRQFEYVLPGNDAGEVRAFAQYNYSNGFAVGEATEYFGGTWPNVTPED